MACNEGKKLRILCLHGYRQNGSTFRSKLGAFRKAVNKHADFIFMSAPLSVKPKEELDDETVSSEITSDVDQRGWWFTRPNDSFNAHDLTNFCKGFDTSLNSVKEMFEQEGPFDGILGFSQGAAFAALLCGLQAQNKLSYHFNFTVLFAGFKSKCLDHEDMYNLKITIPSLHVFGETDKVIPKEMSLELLENFSNSQMLVHSGGHFIPAAKPQKEFYLKFFNELLF